MKQITSEEAKYFRQKHPEVHIAGVNRSKKANRKKYFVEETEKVNRILRRIRGGESVG